MSKHSGSYIVPVLEWRRALYHACETVYCGKQTVDFMYERLCGVFEDDITADCQKYDPDRVELKISFK